MIVKRMVASDDGTVRRYTLPMDVMPIGEGQMNTQREGIQAGVVRRAEEFAHARSYRGAGRFELADYQKALAERSPQERAAERGLGPIQGREPGQRVRAERHFAQQVKTHMGTGLTRVAAIEKATEAERRSGLAEVRAAVPCTPWAAQGWQVRQEQVALFSKLSGSRIGNTTIKLHAEGSPLDHTTTHDEALRTARDVLPRQVAASVLYRGAALPTQAERDWVDHYFCVVNPPPPPTPGGSGAPALADYNRQRQAFIATVIEEARRLLRDPAERQKLRPSPLGG